MIGILTLIFVIALSNNNWMRGHTLADLKLNEEGILVLGIINRDGRYNGIPRGKYTVQEGDHLVVYGKSEHILSLSDRRDKLLGRQEHQKLKKKVEEDLQSEGSQRP
jgi:Trk K+ transport system NAD-binding subunit